MPVYKPSPILGDVRQKASDYLPSWLIDMILSEEPDPSQMMNPMVGVTQFVKGGVPLKGMREAATRQFVEKLERLFPDAANNPYVQKLVQKYPRIFAHAEPQLTPPGATYHGRVQTSRPLHMAGTETYRGAPGQAYLMDIERTASPTKLGKILSHEGTHIGQKLGKIEDFDELYRTATDLFGYGLNPFKQSAYRTMERAFPGWRVNSGHLGKLALGAKDAPFKPLPALSKFSELLQSGGPYYGSNPNDARALIEAILSSR